MRLFHYIILKPIPFNIPVSRYIWPIPIPIPMYRQSGYQYRPYRYWHWYRLLWISVISVLAKYRLKYKDIGQNIRYRSNVGQNINIGIGGRYVGANISVLVSAKISALRIYLYRYRYRPDPYRSNPNQKGIPHFTPQL